MLLRGHLNLAFQRQTMLGFTKLYCVYGDENNIKVQNCIEYIRVFINPTKEKTYRHNNRSPWPEALNSSVGAGSHAARDAN